MEFIPGASFSLAIILGFGIPLALAVIATVLFMVIDEEGLSLGAFLAAAVIGIAGFGTALIQLSNDEIVREKRVIQEIEEDYGLELKVDQLRELDYPEERSEESFEAYGSTEIVEQAEASGEYTGTKVYLIWEDGKLILAKSTDGESFEALEPRN